MTDDKIIAVAHHIAQEAHPEMYDRFARNWRMFEGSEGFPILSDCAALIRDALENMDKKSRAPSKLTAAKHITTNASRDNFHGVWTDSSGRTCMCDGYRAARLTESFASLPVVAPWDDLQKVFDEPEKYSRPLRLPTIAEVKKASAEQKATKGRKCIPAYNFGEDLPLVSCDYLLDMLALFPGAVAYIADTRAEIRPIYFKADNGDGVLLPVRKR